MKNVLELCSRILEHSNILPSSELRAFREAMLQGRPMSSAAAKTEAEKEAETEAETEAEEGGGGGRGSARAARPLRGGPSLRVLERLRQHFQRAPSAHARSCWRPIGRAVPL